MKFVTESKRCTVHSMATKRSLDEGGAREAGKP